MISESMESIFHITEQPNLGLIFVYINCGKWTAGNMDIHLQIIWSWQDELNDMRRVVSGGTLRFAHISRSSLIEQEQLLRLLTSCFSPLEKPLKRPTVDVDDLFYPHFTHMINTVLPSYLFESNRVNIPVIFLCNLNTVLSLFTV